MTRRLLNLLMVLSLLMCAAVVALWVRSYWVSDAVFLGTKSVERGAHSVSGTLALVENGMPNLRPRPGLRRERSDSRGSSPWVDASPLSLPNRAGFGYRETGLPAGHFRLPGGTDIFVPPVITGRMVLVPLWLPVVLFALLPAARLYRRVRPRYHAGRCQRCGYDLRASPGRCPECGATASVSTTG